MAQPTSNQITVPQGLDPTAFILTKAIRMSESSGTDPYNAVGDNGTSHGAYQFQDASWKAWAKQYLGDANAQMTPENQNKVAYSRVADLLKTHTQSEVASIWNSGNPDANAVGKGVNAKLGVSYDVPAYVNKVKQNYLAVQKTIAPSGDSLPPQTVEQTPAPQQSMFGGISQAVGDAVAPVDQKLSNMPGFLGAIGSGIYNAGKGLLTLGKDAAVDSFNAINHPIQTVKNVGSFLGNELTGQETPGLDSVGNLIQSTVGSKGLLGVAQMPGRVIDAALHPEDPNAFSASRALGTTFNAALTALTFGSGSVAEAGIKQSVEKGLLSKSVGEILTQYAGSLPGRSIESGIIGSGFSAANALNQNQPVTLDTLKSGFFTGAALPGVIEKTGDIVGKVPVLGRVVGTTIDAGTQLAKAIGFRGGNASEYEQFKKSAGVVAEDLKGQGFELKQNDPNNLIKLQEAVDNGKQNIWNTVTEKIKAAGGDLPQIDGAPVADAIRQIVAENPKLAFEKPQTVQMLNDLADKYDGKTFTPNEAQAFIKAANNTFAFTEDQGIQNMINTKVRQSLTPALDKLVAKYDGQGVAGLKKLWSAYKAFSDQLDKKVVMEERKAPVDLGTRINVPEAAGKVAEGIANPMGALGKAAGGITQWFANKIMGDRNNVNYRIYRAFQGNPMGEGIIGIMNKLKTPAAISKFLAENPLILHIMQRIYGSEAPAEADNIKVPVKASAKEVKALPEGKGPAIEGSKVINNQPINMGPRSQSTVDATERANANIKQPQDTRTMFGRQELPAGNPKSPQNGPTITPPTPTTYEKAAEQKRSYTQNPRNKTIYQKENGRTIEYVKNPKTGNYEPKTIFGKPKK